MWSNGAHYVLCISTTRLLWVRVARSNAPADTNYNRICPDTHRAFRICDLNPDPDPEAEPGETPAIRPYLDMPSITRGYCDPAMNCCHQASRSPTRGRSTTSGAALTARTAAYACR